MLEDRKLTAAFEETMDRIFSFIDTFPWTDPTSYGTWLAQSFYLTRYTTRVASLTAGRFSIDEDSFHIQALHHLREELGHEHLALHDLRNLGMDIAMIPEFIESRLMIQSQYYFIQQHPCAHFGFVLPLETIACERGTSIAEKVKKTFGPLCESFIRVHAQVDKDHMKEMITIINISPKWTYPLIEENMRQTGLLYSKILQTAATRVTTEKSAA